VDNAIATPDAEALRKAAHRLKGGALNLGATPMHQAALALEQVARDGNLDAAMDAREALLAEIDRLREYAVGLRSEPSRP
jgi:HPt (histidine-containing phosphotransfer) domain-containing protein